MDMNLRLSSGELEKDETEQKDLVNMFDAENKLHNGDGVSEEMVNADMLHVEDDGGINSHLEDMFEFKKDLNLELVTGMEFESHEEAMARQFAEYKNVVGLKNDSRSLFDKGRNLILEDGEANNLLEFLMQLKSINSNFFYAIDVSEDQRLKNLFWVDAKSRHDYIYFSDVVSFDTTYVRNKYKMPLALFIGVNHHYQFLLLGCALLSDESTASFSWVMQTWLTAMGGVAPKVIITDKDQSLEAAVSEVLPSVNHCFALWHILGKVSETLNHVIKQNENFMPKLEKCVLKSWTGEDFEKRWHNLVERFGLKENEWTRSWYEARKQWVPAYMKGIFLAGMSTPQRSESVNCFFDKYVHKETSVQEFLRHYETIVHDMYEEEAKADSDSWNKMPALKTPFPFEEHSLHLYTAAVFKRFQAEVLGTAALAPKDKKFGLIETYGVTEFGTNQGFILSWNPRTSEISCQCRMFEFKGFLCRHALLILQINCRIEVPLQYILKRWTKDAKTAWLIGDASEDIIHYVRARQVSLQTLNPN